MNVADGTLNDVTVPVRAAAAVIKISRGGNRDIMHWLECPSFSAFYYSIMRNAPISTHWDLRRGRNAVGEALSAVFFVRAATSQKILIREHDDATRRGRAMR